MYNILTRHFSDYSETYEIYFHSNCAKIRKLWTFLSIFFLYLYDCIKDRNTNTSNAPSLLKQLGEKTLANRASTSFARTRLLCKTRPVRQSLTLMAALALANSLSLSFHPFPSTETISGVRRVLARFSIKNLTEKSKRKEKREKWQSAEC